MCLLITRLCMPVFAKTKPWAWVTEETVATLSCGTGNFGVRGQSEARPRFGSLGWRSGTVKAPSPLRFAAHSKGPACHLSCGLLCKRGDHLKRKKKAARTVRLLQIVDDRASTWPAGLFFAPANPNPVVAQQSRCSPARYFSNN